MSPFAVAAGLALVGAAPLGCGDGGAADAKAITGTYDVTITAGARSDMDVMNVTQGADGTALLDFAQIGFSQMRAKMTDHGKFTIPAQTVHVEHSTGIADGVATGMGTISTAGAVDITVSIGAAGGDGGAGSDGGAGMSYKISGTKQ